MALDTGGATWEQPATLAQCPPLSANGHCCRSPICEGDTCIILQVLDGVHRIIVLEAIAEGGLKRVLDVLMPIIEDGDGVKVLLNASIPFAKREYIDWPPLVAAPPPVEEEPVEKVPCPSSYHPYAPHFISLCFFPPLPPKKPPRKRGHTKDMALGTLILQRL